MKQVIVLEKLNDSGTSFKYVLWAAVPLARRPFYTNASFVSEYKGATLQELSDLQNGIVAERVGTVQIKESLGIPQIKTLLTNAWQSFQDELNSKNQWSHYGTSWDGTSWTAGGVA